MGSVSGRADNVAVSATPAATTATTAELLDGEGEAELSADFDGLGVALRHQVMLYSQQQQQQHQQQMLELIHQICSMLM